MFQSTGKCEKLRKKKDERKKKKKQVQANNYINLYFGNATQEFLSISNVLRKQLIWNGEVPLIRIVQGLFCGISPFHVRPNRSQKKASHMNPRESLPEKVELSNSRTEVCLSLGRTRKVIPPP